MDNSENNNEKMDVKFVRSQIDGTNPSDSADAYRGDSANAFTGASANAFTGASAGTSANAFTGASAGTSASAPAGVSAPFTAAFSDSSKKAGKKKKKKGVKAAIIVGIILVAAIVLIVIFAKTENTNAGVIGGVGEDYIGVMYIEGNIMSSSDAGTSETYQHDWLLENVDSMIDDDHNKAIMLYVNSPGGTSYESDEMYRKLMEYKSDTGRPIYAYFASEAASGAYYIASAADYIAADRNTLTGSIGVYMGPILDASELLTKVGVKADIIKSSENKAIGSGYEPVTDEQKAIYQSIIDDIYERFLGIVIDSRGYTEAKAREIADGRPYTATQALENGLIDEICTFDEVLDEMIESEFLEDCARYDIRYTPESSIYSGLLGIGSSLKELADSKKSEAEQALELVEEASDVKAYCLMR